MTAAPRRCNAWIALQLVTDALARRWREQQRRDDDVIDVRDPLLELDRCSSCGQPLTDRVEVT